MTTMIARTWRGVTRASDADRYADYVAATGLRAFAQTPGNTGAMLMRRPMDVDGSAGTEFLVISFWESMDAVKRFAGPEPSKAVFYPEDDAYLVRRELTVDHFEVLVRQAGPTSRPG
jgi:heme-degrading monooxygenase HmoA